MSSAAECSPSRGEQALQLLEIEQVRLDSQAPSRAGAVELAASLSGSRRGAAIME